MEQYVVFLKALKGVRRLHTFGILYGVKIEKRAPVRCPYFWGRIVYEGKVDFIYRKFYLIFVFDIT